MRYRNKAALELLVIKNPVKHWRFLHRQGSAPCTPPAPTQHRQLCIPEEEETKALERVGWIDFQLDPSSVPNPPPGCQQSQPDNQLPILCYCRNKGEQQEGTQSFLTSVPSSAPAPEAPLPQGLLRSRISVAVPGPSTAQLHGSAPRRSSTVELRAPAAPQRAVRPKLQRQYIIPAESSQLSEMGSYLCTVFR